jgi:hypothetical protein
MEGVLKGNPTVEEAVKQVSQNVRISAELFKQGVAERLAEPANFNGRDIEELWRILQKQNNEVLKEMYRKLSVELGERKQGKRRQVTGNR